jgi:hypothetical protein
MGKAVFLMGLAAPAQALARSAREPEASRAAIAGADVARMITDGDCAAGILAHLDWGDF